MRLQEATCTYGSTFPKVYSGTGSLYVAATSRIKASLWVHQYLNLPSVYTSVTDVMSTTEARLREKTVTSSNEYLHVVLRSRGLTQFLRHFGETNTCMYRMLTEEHRV